MAPSKLSQTEFPLPLELLCEIIKLLPLTDLQTLPLVSRLTRSQVIHLIFEHILYTDDIPAKVRKIHQARKDVKVLIKSACLFYCDDNILLDIIRHRKLELSSEYIITGQDEGLVIFQS